MTVNGMTVLKDLGMLYTTAKSRYKHRYWLVECPQCFKPYKVVANSIKIKRSTQCSSCRQESVKYIKKFIPAASAVHDNKYDYSDSTVTSSRDMVEVVCPSHGKFTQEANAHLRGQGCPSCSRTKKHTNAEYDILLKEIHGDTIKRIENYISNRVKIAHLCECGNIWKTLPNSLLMGSSCPICNRGTDGDSFYIWNIKGTDIYKIGITSQRLGMARMDSVITELSIKYKKITAIIEVTYEGDLARKFEKDILTNYTTKPTCIPDCVNGSNEFRILTREELNTIKKEIKKK